MTRQKSIKTYQLSGYVWGKCWGGGECGYKSETVEGKTKAEVIAKAEQMLADGSLDSGMGYESLTGANLELLITTKIKIGGKWYFNHETEKVLLGSITDEQIEVTD